MLRVCVVCVLLTVGVHGEDSLMRDILNKIQEQDLALSRQEAVSRGQDATLSRQAARLAAQDAVIARQAARIEQLEEAAARHDSFVGFHATTEGNRRLNQGDTLKLDIVVTNEGAGGYNKEDGAYTCGTGGFYLFTQSTFADYSAAFSLYVGDTLVTTNHANGSWGWATLAAVVSCPQGARVTLRCVRDVGCSVRDSNPYVRATTFSGVLLSASP